MTDQTVEDRIRAALQEVAERVPDPTVASILRPPRRHRRALPD